MSRTSIFTTWVQMRRRCLNPKSTGYRNYGGRGIGICDTWQQSFVAFQSYVSGLAHYGEPGYTLDRINNDGNYEPGNVRWATQVEQINNSRVVRLLTYNGKTLSVTEWAKEVGINKRVLWTRLYQGWTIERALTQPVGKPRGRQ